MTALRALLRLAARAASAVLAPPSWEFRSSSYPPDAPRLDLSPSVEPRRLPRSGRT